MMFIISNFIDSPKNVKKRRWNKKRKEYLKEEIINTVNIYSRLMKGVDLSNQLISYDEFNRTSIKLWKRIFFHLLDIAIVNLFIKYKKYLNANITLKQYRIEIIKIIIKKYNMKIGRIDNKFNVFHYPVKQLKCGTCKNCSFTKDYTTVKAPTSKYMCNVCKIYLCIDCFEIFLTKKF